ncbi:MULTISPECIES: flagellar hook-basal body complex protein FliE [Clostridium]|jgi:flagellar hook-basal body complex protein FliE|uniref:flagellar hook-basal body complex protein FliE n=1 Tax=Clostridium TaxID=1485 RepID=UPI000288D57D|nr:MULTISPECIES: flagellar hook-basal body complex protein FliE [Clostridium]MDF2504827.1 flagellar hook-basal body complex protein FliE [Clostridium sp.]
MNVNQFIPNSVISNLDSMVGSNTNNNVNTDNNGGLDFSSILKDKLDGVNDKQVSADNITNQFISGDDVDVHQVMLSTQEAQMSLQLAVQMRNKIVEAYQELNRMQV